jgi:uncharacterized protein
VSTGTEGERDIHRPLGQSDRRGGRRFNLPGRGKVAAAMLVIGVAAVATAIAWREQPFRAPPPVAVSVPEPAGQESTDAASSSPSLRDGASVLRVEPPRLEDSPSVVVIRDPSALSQDFRTAHLPDRALLEDSEYGPLPVRAADGRRPFDVYARPWSGARGARVAIVIGGLGLSQTGTQNAIETLPGEVTLAFAPHGNSLDRWMQAARRGGHEIVLQLPLEPFDYPNVDPGRDTLTVSSGPAENTDRLLRTLSRITNYVGVVNYMGARFTQDEAAMSSLMAELGRRGLMFVDDGTSSRSIADRLAPANGAPFAAAQATLDAQRDRAAILERLDDLERIARAQGFAIGTGSAFDITVDTVTSWVAEARRRGIEIVPVSALANDPGR